MIKQRRYRSLATPVPPMAAAAATKHGTDTPGADARKTATRKTRPGMGKGKSQGVELGEQIGDRLKAMFKDVLAEPVPEKFHQLLEKLERRSGKL
jgi:hypothetical protein